MGVSGFSEGWGAGCEANGHKIRKFSSNKFRLYCSEENRIISRLLRKIYKFKSFFKHRVWRCAESSRKSSFVHSADLCRGGVRVRIRVSRDRVRIRGRGRLELRLTDMLCICWVYENSWPKFEVRSVNHTWRQHAIDVCGSRFWIPVPSRSSVIIHIPITVPEQHYVHSHSHWIPVGKSETGIPVRDVNVYWWWWWWRRRRRRLLLLLLLLLLLAMN